MNRVKRDGKKNVYKSVISSLDSIYKRLNK